MVRVRSGDQDVPVSMPGLRNAISDEGDRGQEGQPQKCHNMRGFDSCYVSR